MLNNFEWDSAKAETNLKKHGISFEEAKSVFYDDYARVKPDPDHSIVENRFIIQGVSKQNRLLVISFADRNEKIRIISARKSTNREKKQYEEFL